MNSSAITRDDRKHLKEPVTPTATGDVGTNDIIVSDVIRTGELQVWFLAQHRERV